MTVAIDPEPADSPGERSSPDVSGSELSATVLTMLANLDSSLVASQKAVLALDLEAIEHQTREQIALTKELELALAGAEAPGKSSNQAIRLAPSGLQKELRDRAMQVRDAARLQLALLARAQRKLRTLANVLAGPETTYGNFLRMEPNVLPRAIELSSATAHGQI